MRIGFIGVGNIGNPMAGHLLAAGHSLVVHDLRREAAANLLAAGAAWADSPRAAAAKCDVIATCLPGPSEMEAVTRGPGGILEALSADAVYIDHTTNSPLLVRQVDTAVRARGAAMLDAPVSGGMEGARTRDLLVMVGGERAVFERARPVLDAVATRVIYTGAIGNGSVCKLMHNCASFSLDLVMAECWSAGVKAGVAPETLVDVFMNAALGHMMSLKVRLPATYLRGQFDDARFALRLAHKDVGLAVQLGRAYGVPMRLSTLCEQELAEAMARGWGERDASIVLTLQEERASVQVRLPG
jgi:3-hydroxyisobutyrate dehydrogenase-like beta-hydroxyacid dehydrogenase